MRKYIIALAAVLAACSGEPETAPATAIAPAAETKSAEPKRELVRAQIDAFAAELADINSNADVRRASLAELRTGTNKSVASYTALVAELKTGAKPGDAAAIAKWEEAGLRLGEVASFGESIGRLAADVEADAAVAEYVRANATSTADLARATGAERSELAVLSARAETSAADAKAFARSLLLESERQKTYVENEKLALSNMAIAIKDKKAPAAAPGAPITSPFTSDEAFSEFTASPAASALPGRRAIVSVRFGTDEPDFEIPVREALSRSLERNPSARFTVAGVAPEGSRTIERRIKGMTNALSDMGLPAARVKTGLYSSNVALEEVRIYEE